MIKKSISFVVATTALSLAGVANAAEYEVSVTNITSGVYFTPLIVSAHSSDVAMFNVGTESSTQLQAIAEGGDISSMAELLESVGANVATGAGLLGPGASATFTINSSDVNTVLSLSSMLLPTNDGFVGLNSVALPNSIGTSSHFFARGYDAGTEANDELVGSGAPGEAGFPAPPPVVASGTGTGGHGVPAEVEGFISIHRGVLGDLDPEGGFSDINSAVHRWNNPVASVTVTMVGGDSSVGTGNAPSAVIGLAGQVYSSSAVEIFWEASVSLDSVITEYEIKRNGEPVSAFDGLSYFDDGLNAGVEYTYSVRAIDANGMAGEYQSVVLRTNAN